MIEIRGPKKRILPTLGNHLRPLVDPLSSGNTGDTVISKLLGRRQWGDFFFRKNPSTVEYWCVFAIHLLLCGKKNSPHRGLRISPGVGRGETPYEQHE
jgi:hypothetical protein